jgi:large subunit ribosomal protein L10
VDRTEKREFVAGLHEALADISMIVVTHNTGLTVAEATDLRRRMRAAGVTFRVAKNRLAHLALEGTRFDGLKPMLTGPTALAWSTDPVAAAKATVEFARTNDKLVLIGGALGPQTLDASGVRALAELPSLDTLRARMLQARGPLPDLTAAENDRVWRSLTSRRRRPQLQALLGVSDAAIEQKLAGMRLARSMLTVFTESR